MTSKRLRSGDLRVDLAGDLVGDVLDGHGHEDARARAVPELVGAGLREVAVDHQVALGLRVVLERALHAVVVRDDEPVGRHERGAAAAEGDDRPHRLAGQVREGLRVALEAHLLEAGGELRDLLGHPHAFVGERAGGEEHEDERENEASGTKRSRDSPLKSTWRPRRARKALDYAPQNRARPSLSFASVPPAARAASSILCGRDEALPGPRGRPRRPPVPRVRRGRRGRDLAGRLRAGRPRLGPDRLPRARRRRRRRVPPPPLRLPLAAGPRDGPRRGRDARAARSGPRGDRGPRHHGPRGRAHGAQPRPAPERRRDEDPRVRRRAEGDEDRPPRHAEDDAGPPPPRAVRRALRRRHEPPLRPRVGLPREGQPRRRRRQRVGGDAPRQRLPRAEPEARAAPPRGRGPHARRGAPGARRRRRAHPARQHDRRRDGRRRRGRASLQRGDGRRA